MQEKVQSPIVTIDLHGKNTYNAKIIIDAALKRSNGVFRLRIIHGYHSGTTLRDMIFEEYAKSPKVKRLLKINDGTTDLILREL